jgi:hypothetical protein
MPAGGCADDEGSGVERLCSGVHTGGCLPAKAEAEAITGLPIRQALDGLQEHHRRHHAGRDRRTSPPKSE